MCFANVRASYEALYTAKPFHVIPMELQNTLHCAQHTEIVLEDHYKGSQFHHVGAFERLGCATEIMLDAIA